VLVIERAYERGLVNHVALVHALRNHQTADSEKPLAVRVFSDYRPTASQAAHARALDDDDGGRAATQAQVLALFAAAAVVVAPHGAGLANMLVMRYEARTPALFAPPGLA
jgi:hypothetical protein